MRDPVAFCYILIGLVGLSFAATGGGVILALVSAAFIGAGAFINNYS